jgi:hypothetical protein
MTASRTQTTMQAYLDVISALWPGSAPTLDGTATDRRAQFLVVPSRRSPRLLVPRHNHAAASAAMRRFSSSLTPGETVKRLAVAAALRGRLDRLFPDRLTYDDVRPSLVGHLADVLGEQVDVSIGLGSARQNRKPVLQVFDRRGRSLAFVKVGDNPAARGHVEAEARAFVTLRGHQLPPDLEIPDLIWQGDWEGLVLLVITALETSPRQHPGQWVLPTATMDAFSRSFGHDEQRLTDCAWWPWADATPALVSDVPTRERLRDGLDGLAGLASDRRLPIGAWHGDWTPWNQSRSRGRLQLWDWERFEVGVPIGLDRVHYAVNAKLRSDGATPASLREGLRLAGTEQVVSATYLAAVTCRYLRLVEEDYGELLVDRARLFLSALLELVDGER